MAQPRVQVPLKQPVDIEEVDSEIVVVAGCALGFVAQGQPPHVLHVDPGTETSNHDIQSDDLLVAIDDLDPRNLSQQEVAKALRGAKLIVFERPKGPAEGDDDTEPPSEGERERNRAESNAATEGAVEERSEVPAAEGGDSAVEQRAKARSRSRKRRKSARSGVAAAPPSHPVAEAPPPRPPSGASPSGPPKDWTGPPAGAAPGWPPPPHYAAPPPRGPAGPPRWPAPPHWAHPPPPRGYSHAHPPQPLPPYDAWRGRAPHPAHWRPHPSAVDPRMQAHPNYHHRDGGRDRSPRHRPQRIEPNESGGATLVATQVPPSVNNMDVLTEYFASFGEVTALQVNHNRHEAMITFSRVADAEKALRSNVLNDPSIGLRPWRNGAGRGPHEVPALNSIPDVPTAAPPGAPFQPKALDQHPAAGGNETPATATPAGGSPNSNKEADRPKTDGTAGQPPLIPAALEKKRQLQELEDKRKALLANLTDQLKVVMSRISDPKTTEKNREKLQTLMGSIKDKVLALKPKEPEPPRPPPMPAQAQRPPRPPRRSWGSTPWKWGPGGPRPGQSAASLRLSMLPPPLRRSDAGLEKALGEGVSAIQSWSDDGASCVVRFVDRRYAEAAFYGQKVLGFTAEWHAEGAPHADGQLAFRPAAQAAELTEPAPGTPETEDMDTDMEDEEMMELLTDGRVAGESESALGRPTDGGQNESIAGAKEQLKATEPATDATAVATATELGTSVADPPGGTATVGDTAAPPPSHESKGAKPGSQSQETPATFSTATPESTSAAATAPVPIGAEPAQVEAPASCAGEGAAVAAKEGEPASLSAAEHSNDSLAKDGKTEAPGLTAEHSVSVAKGDEAAREAFVVQQATAESESKPSAEA